MKQKAFQQSYDQQHLQDQKEIVGVLDSYLSRHIEFVKQSRSNEVKVLEKIKESLKEKLGEIKVVARDIPRRSLGAICERSITGRRKYDHSKRKTSEMDSFESQINQCDKLLKDLGFKCKQYASGDYSNYSRGIEKKIVKIKTESMNSKEHESERKLPLLKLRNRTEEVETQSRKKYDHVGDALLVVPTQIGDMGSTDKRSVAPTSRSNRNHRSRKQSIDIKKNSSNIVHPIKLSINPQQSIVKKSSKQFSKTIEVQHMISPIKNLNLYSTRNTPKYQQDTFDQPSSSVPTLQKNNEQILHQNVKLKQQDFKNTSQIVSVQKLTHEMVEEKSHDKSQKPTENKEIQLKDNEQQLMNSEKKQIKCLINQIKNEQQILQLTDQKEYLSNQKASFINRQKSIIPYLSQAKMRGLKLYQRIRQYKAKNGNI